MTNQEIVESQDNWKPKVLVVGAVLGAVVGVAATYLLIQRYGDDQPPQINLTEGVKIGVLVAGLLRSIATL
jgi:high-affinity Fe2+/Pb2+ permease